MRRHFWAVALLAAVLPAGCADDWSEPHPAPSAVGALGAGFVTAAPTPEATITPAPGSWDDVRPSAGYRVVLLFSSRDAPTSSLVTSVKQWADESGVDLRTVEAGHDPVPDIVKALDLHPDLIVSAGNDLVDPLTLVTPSHLDQHFLVVGAELAEPTHNVTSVDWAGASFRGEGLGSASTYDPASFTAARCADAIRAGAAAVLSGLTGIVVWLT